MRKLVVFASAVAVLTTPLAVHAADQKDKKDTKKAAPAPAAAPSADQPNPVDVKRGVIIIKSFTAALNSDKVDNERKGKYVACLYNNPVKNITAATDKIIAGNPKLNGDDPTHVFLAASAACKALPAENAQAPAAGNTPSGKQPEGR